MHLCSCLCPSVSLRSAYVHVCVCVPHCAPQLPPIDHLSLRQVLPIWSINIPGNGGVAFDSADIGLLNIGAGIVVVREMHVLFYAPQT